MKVSFSLSLHGAYTLIINICSLLNGILEIKILSDLKIRLTFSLSIFLENTEIRPILLPKAGDICTTPPNSFLIMFRSFSLR